MFCKNCGHNIDPEAAICLKCGFANGSGDKYCAHCGKGVASGQVLCVNCGFLVDGAESLPKAAGKSKKTPEKSGRYKAYTEKVRSITMRSIVAESILLAFLIAIAFLPIYKYEYEPTLDDISNMEEFSEVLENDGMMEKNFSLFDDMTHIFEILAGEESFEMEKTMFFLLGMMGIFEFVFIIVVGVISIVQIKERVDELNNIDNMTMLKYSEVKKSGNVKKKENIFKKQWILSVILFGVFDVIYCKAFGMGIEPDMLANIAGSDYIPRYMYQLSGVSLYIVVVGVLLVAQLYVQAKRTKQEKELLVEITQEEYDA